MNDDSNVIPFRRRQSSWEVTCPRCGGSLASVGRPNPRILGEVSGSPSGTDAEIELALKPLTGRFPNALIVACGPCSMFYAVTT